MNRIILAALAGAAVSVGAGQIASAADIPAPVYKAPPAVIVAWNWSGFYLGGQAGWQRSKIDLSSDAGPLTYSPTHSSFAAGGFGGVQQQFGQIVLGIEGGYVAGFGETSLGSTPSIPIFAAGGTGTAQARMRDIWSVGGRAGWALAQWMPYITGGYASGRFRFNAQSGGTTEEARATANGWYLGGGVDWALTNNWIVGVEYRHYAFRSTTVFALNSAGGSENVTFKPRTDMVMGRVSYKFGWQ